MRKSEFVDRMAGLPPQRVLCFYESLVHELTVAVRYDWDDDTLSKAEQVEQMKWLNEIQHRTVSKLRSERLALPGMSTPAFFDNMAHYVRLCRSIGPLVDCAIKSAIKVAEM